MSHRPGERFFIDLAPVLFTVIHVLTSFIHSLIRSSSHSTSLQAQAFLDDEEALEQLSRWTVAFPKVLMWHVRESCDLRTELQVAAMLSWR